MRRLGHWVIGWCLLVLCSVAPAQASESPSPSPQVEEDVLQAAAVAANVLADPTNALLALDDSRMVEALTEISRAIALSPTDPGLRLVRSEIQYATGPWAFAAAVAADGASDVGGLYPPPIEETEDADGDPIELMALPTLGNSAADRWEAACRLYIRVRHERVFYSGDGGEEPEAFIERMEALSAATEVAVAARTLGDPAGGVVQWEVSHWLEGEPMSLQAALGGPLVDIPTETRRLVDWQLLEAMDRGLSFGEGAALMASPTVWQQRAALEQANQSLSQTAWLDRPDVLVALRKTITEPSLIDDLDLAIARELMQQFDSLKLARDLLEPITLGPWNNSVTNATRSLGAYQRRAGLDDDVLNTYEVYNARLPAWGEPIRRQYGRALYRLERYHESVVQLTLLVDSPWGQARDYLYVADSTRFVTSPDSALQLVEFSTALRERELEVEGWRKGVAPQFTALKIRMFEVGGTLRHARIFPATFVSMAAVFLLDALALGLGLIILAAFPRLSAIGWRWGIALALVGLALQAGLLWSMTGEAEALGVVASVSWLGYGTARTFFFGGGAVVIAAATGLPGLGLIRSLGRGLRSGQFWPQLWRAWPLVLALVPVALLVPFALGVGESTYLARLPAALTGAAFGSTGSPSWEVTSNLTSLYHALTFELLMRGLVLGLVVYAVGGLLGATKGGWRRRLTYGLAIFVTAFFSAGLSAGVGAPSDDAFWLFLFEGLLLGWLAVNRGVDAAVLLHIGAVLLWGVA